MVTGHWPGGSGPGPRLEEWPGHVGQRQVRRRTKNARLAVPALLASAVLTPTMLLIVWLVTGRTAEATGATGLCVVLALCRVLLSGPPAPARRALAGRPALDDLLPAELWAQRFVRPIATVAVSALSSAALTIGSLTVGEDPVISVGWRVYTVLLLLFSASSAVVVPVGTAYRAVRHRAEDEVAAFHDARGCPAVHRSGLRAMTSLRARRPPLPSRHPGRAWRRAATRALRASVRPRGWSC